MKASWRPPRNAPWPGVPTKTRRIMAAIHGRNTKPELLVRRLLHSLGYRYRIHLRSVGGRPDISFPKRKKAIFVHGCFWHGHECRAGRVPGTRPEFWRGKLQANKDRDLRHLRALVDAGWEALVIWECELKDAGALERKLCGFLGERRFRPNR
jgi:DNA mismatch endonuclease (patch repair protein)